MMSDMMFGQQADGLHMPRVCDKDAPPRDLFVKSWIFYDALASLKTSNMAPYILIHRHRKDKNCVDRRAFDWLRIDL